jgi:hypothetical protein
VADYPAATATQEGGVYVLGGVGGSHATRAGGGGLEGANLDKARRRVCSQQVVVAVELLVRLLRARQPLPHHLLSFPVSLAPVAQLFESLIHLTHFFCRIRVDSLKLRTTRGSRC